MWTDARLGVASGGAALLVALGALAGCGAGSSSAGLAAGGAGAGTTSTASTGTASTGAASTGAASTGAASTGAASTGTASTGTASTGTASTGTASPGGGSASCTTAVSPTRRVTLGPADSGRTICLVRGALVSVVLPGSQDRPWRFQVRGSAVVPATDTRFALPVGRQGAAYRAAAPGTARLLAARTACPSPKPGEMACMAVEQSWSVSVVVS